MPFPSFRSHACGLILAAGLIPAGSASAYTVYVSSEKDNIISVFDGESLARQAEVKVGQRPRGIALSHDNKVLYICTSDEDHIEVLDLETLKITHTLPSGPDPELLALGPDGRFLYVANEDDNMVTVVDVDKRTKVTEIQEDDVLHIWEMRLILEPYAASLAAQMDLSPEIEVLENTFARILENPTDLDLYMEADIRLHQLFYSRLDNPLLVNTIQNTLRRSMRVRYFAEKVPQSPENVVRVVTGEHREILDALKSGDGQAVASALTRHLRNGEQRTSEALRQRSAT